MLIVVAAKSIFCPQAQVDKLRDERETAGRDAAVLRTDLDATRSDRDRAAAEGAALKAELDK